MLQVQATQDEGDQRTASAEAGATEGLDEDSHGVALRGGGWVVDIATTGAIAVTPEVEHDGVKFKLVHIPELELSHAACMLVLQGATMQYLFPPDAHFDFQGGNERFVEGPFIMIRGELTPFDKPPLLIKHLALAKVISHPEEMKKDELLGALLKAL
jgi:hypothetical protein